MFSLEKTTAKITSYNSRSETHGKEEVPACDIRFEAKVSNDVLSEFGSQLRAALYWKSEQPQAEPQQGELDAVEPVSDLPNLRCPKLRGPFEIEYEGAGYVLTVDYGVGGKSAIELGDCKVNDVKINPHEGGSVTLTFRVSHSDIEERAAGKLSRMVKREVTITLTPPAAESERLAA